MERCQTTMVSVTTDRLSFSFQFSTVAMKAMDAMKSMKAKNGDDDKKRKNGDDDKKPNDDRKKATNAMHATKNNQHM